MRDVNIQLVPNSFIESPIFDDEYIFGSDKSLSAVKILNLGGDWRGYIPRFEEQFKNGVESMSCVTYGTLNVIEILLEHHHDILNQDYSERYTSTLAGTTRSGNSPQKVAETVRKYGLITEMLLPFNDSINTWEKYFAHISSGLKRKGKKWLKDWEFGHEWIITRDTNVADKIPILENALKISPVGVSVFGWADIDGIYVKEGNDTHWCVLLYGDKDYWYVLDSYAPFMKRLEKSYDFGFAKQYTVDMSEIKKNWIYDLFIRLFGW